jgi:CubicO group peptidase (beta-lactamase class C family)
LAKTGEDPLAYLERRVFEPIGMTYADWQRDRAGHPFLAKGASLRAEEWAKFGHLVLARGEWEGEQVLDPDLLDECFVPGPDFPGYGMTWWMNVPIGDWASRIPNEQVPIDPLDAATPAALITPAAPADLVAAAGHKDNRLYISRSANLVVVRLADGHRKFRDAAFLELLFKP